MTIVRLAWIAGVAVLVLLGIAAGFLLWATGGRGSDAPFASFPIEEETSAPSAGQPPVRAEGRLRIMTYNVAYCRGPRDDAGDLRDRPTVEGYIRKVAEAIRAYEPDIVALQEVDFDSHRTHGIDQAKEIARLTGLRHLARIPTWEANYVAWPYWPPSQHYRRMRSGQIVLARFPIVRNDRYRFPQPSASPWWYNLFYLHRAVQVVDVAVEGHTVRVFNTHLEAFDTANREEQAGLLAGIFARERTGADLILGDMNAVPPEAVRKNAFPDEPGYDGNGDSTIPTLRAIEGLSEIVPPERYAEDEAAFLSFPADGPTRRLDYVFFSDVALSLVSGRVFHEAGPASDHLPVVADLRIVPSP